MAEKNGFDITTLNDQNMCGTVVQWSMSCLHMQMNHVRLPVKLFSVSLFRFFLFSLFFLIQSTPDN